jgi:hypothetical protein
MKKYNFLLKPVFFIFSLFFATWLVIEIEKLSPSDFGEPNQEVPLKMSTTDKFTEQKECLKNICFEFKTGKIDSLKLDKKLAKLLEIIKSDSVK